MHVSTPPRTQAENAYTFGPQLDLFAFEGSRTPPPPTDPGGDSLPSGALPAVVKAPDRTRSPEKSPRYREGKNNGRICDGWVEGVHRTRRQPRKAAAKPRKPRGRPPLKKLPLGHGKLQTREERQADIAFFDRHGWMPIKKAAVTYVKKHTRKDSMERRVAMHLLEYLGYVPRRENWLQCWPAQDTIARKLGVCLRSVKRAIHQLKKIGVYTTDRFPLHQPDNAPPVNYNRYTLCIGQVTRDLFVPLAKPPRKRALRVDSNLFVPLGPYKGNKKKHYGADAHVQERPNIQRAQERDVIETLKVMERIRQACKHFEIDPASTGGIIATDPEYRHKTVPILRAAVQWNRDSEYVATELENLRWEGVTKRSRLIQLCLDALAEKDCFANAAIRRVFQDPASAWRIIGGCHWDRTSGPQLVQMLSEE